MPFPLPLKWSIWSPKSSYNCYWLIQVPDCFRWATGMVLPWPLGYLAGNIYSWHLLPRFFAYTSQTFPTTTTINQHCRIGRGILGYKGITYISLPVQWSLTDCPNSSIPVSTLTYCSMIFWNLNLPQLGSESHSLTPPSQPGCKR